MHASVRTCLSGIRGIAPALRLPPCTNGEVVYSFPLGKVAIDPQKTKTAEEYIVVYGFAADGTPRKVDGQYTIYDSRPGEDRYGLIWHHNYVIVPQDYVPQTLRSEADVLASGFEVRATDVYTN